MSAYRYTYTSESVSEGHPDKMADQISDAIVDAILEKDNNARVAVETLLKADDDQYRHGLCILAGEVHTQCPLSKSEYEDIARRTICDIGYQHSELGFDGNRCEIQLIIGEQSKEIHDKVDKGKELGAGDQGLMYGYACDHNSAYLPATLYYAHALMARQAHLRKSGKLSWLRPDAKSQVCMSFDEQGNAKEIESVIISTQHAEGIELDDLRNDVQEQIIQPVLPQQLMNNARILVNATGDFIIGGPLGDCGLTGRKIIIDSYGGVGRHGGGAFSGKDPSKVDRSAAYAGRYIAKNIVGAGLAKRCEVHLAYLIGESKPTCVNVDTFGTGQLQDSDLCQIVREHFPLSVSNIIDTLQLKQQRYRPTATYGHFGMLGAEHYGRDTIFPWEQTDKVELLKRIT